MSTHEIPVLVTARRAICGELTPSRMIENLIPISVQNRSLISTDLPFTLSLMNVCSIKSKSASFIEYVSDSNADLIALTETWLTFDDTAACLEIVPNGYKLINHPRTRCKGGGRGQYYCLENKLRVSTVRRIRSTIQSRLGLSLRSLLHTWKQL